LAKAAVELIKDQNNYQRIIKAARVLVEEKYSYKTIAHILDKFYQEVSHGKKN